jgi:hypothetical protein
MSWVSTESHTPVILITSLGLPITLNSFLLVFVKCVIVVWKRWYRVVIGDGPWTLEHSGDAALVIEWHNGCCLPVGYASYFVCLGIDEYVVKMQVWVPECWGLLVHIVYYWRWNHSWRELEILV